MAYVRDSLGRDEHIVEVATKHWIVFVPGVIIALVGVGAFVSLYPEVRIWPIFSFLPLVWGIIEYITTEFVVTNRKIVAKVGVISRITIEQRLEKIDSVRVIQGIFGRMLNYGTIIVAGSGISETAVPRIADPIAFRQKIESATEGSVFPGGRSSSSRGRNHQYASATTGAGGRQEYWERNERQQREREGWLLSAVLPDGKIVRFELPFDGRSQTIGRSTREADFVLNEESVSRLHARFDQSVGLVWIADLGSLNHTFVNEVEVKAEPVVLRLTDRIRLGGVNLTISTL